MKVTIDLEKLKDFINTLSNDKDEWYGPENYMSGTCIYDFLYWNGNDKIAKEFKTFLNNELATED